MIKLAAIAAVSDNWALGRNNELLWHLPEDFKFFKQSTLNATIIMGRKTFESIGKALPKRRNIVLTRDQSWSAENVECYNSIESLAMELNNTHTHFVIGGGEIYKQFLPHVSEAYLTHVHAKFDNADAFFPVLDENNWQIEELFTHPKDERHAFSFTVKRYLRK